MTRVAVCIGTNPEPDSDPPLDPVFAITLEIILLSLFYLVTLLKAMFYVQECVRLF